MNRKITITLSLITILILTLILGSGIRREEKPSFNIVTSFYPTYILVKNLTEGIPNIKVTNIVTSTTGCIHDYTLTPSDMMKIEDADTFIINGAGMEGFINNVSSAYPTLTVIDASNGITLLEGNHEGESEYNSHVWMNPINYIKQVENVSSSLANIDPNNKKKYEENANNYISKINTLIMTMNQELNNIKNKKVIIFHDAFAYLADYLKLDIIRSVDMDQDETLSANEVKEIINDIKKNKVSVLLVEKQFTNNIIDTIKNEVKVNVYTLDTGVTGIDSLDAYINAMNNNILILKGALS